MNPEGPERQETRGAAISGPARRRRWGRWLLLGLPIAFLMLAGWHRVASSDEFCSSCHTMEPATLTAARSVHAEVTCIECHSGTGVWGSVKYLPTLARESLATITNLDVASGVLPARTCDGCHGDPAATPPLAPAHSGPRSEDCETCHGDVSHPVLVVPGAALAGGRGENPHPSAYTQTHGREAVDQPSTCIECHEEDFCQACHFRETYPHPQGWIERHGPAQEEQGPESCTLCHEPTFCAGCHGTEIPHEPDWTAQHWRDLQDAPVTPCLTCHVESDCTTCHSRHAVHTEQSLFS